LGTSGKVRKDSGGDDQKTKRIEKKKAFKNYYGGRNKRGK